MTYGDLQLIEASTIYIVVLVCVYINLYLCIYVYVLNVTCNICVESGPVNTNELGGVHLSNREDFPPRYV